MWALRDMSSLLVYAVVWKEANVVPFIVVVESRAVIWQKIQSSTHLTKGPMPSDLVVSAQTP